MKKLVLGALIIAAASTGCIISSDSDSIVTARWTFKHIANGAARSCPTGFNTATIIAQPVDRESIANTGNLVTADLFNCDAGQGTITLPSGLYLVSVRIETDSGSQTYADSEAVLVDAARGDSAFDVEILDDGGYFFVTWALKDSVTNASMSCAQADLTGSTAAVDLVSTSVANSNFFRNDRYTCEDHYGTTSGLPAGSYNVQVNAETAPLDVVGEAPLIQNKVIRAPNGTTDLGHVIISID